jgi:hypothetical protein
MTPKVKHDAAPHGRKQESRRTGLRPGHPATMTVPRGNGRTDAGDVQRSVQRLVGILGH